MANAQATEPSVVLLIGREALASLIHEYPQIGLATSRVLAGRLRDMAQVAGDLSLRGVLPRMAGLLLRLAGTSSVASLPTRNELAAMVGTVREVATRSLRQLESSGAIRLDARSAVILDRAQLERHSGGGACPACPRVRSWPSSHVGPPSSGTAVPAPASFSRRTGPS
jgi:CRP/FNR family transcriptional regulator, cyclic AMP receptor protein